MDAHILLSPVGQKTETRFNCFLTENRKSTEMVGTPSTVCVYSFHRCGGPPPSKREVWGFAGQGLSALPSIGYRGFAVAPMTLRAPSRNPLYNSGCRVATLVVLMGVMGFLGDLRGRNSKSPPNPLGLAERVSRPAGGGRSPQTMIPPRSPTPHSFCEFGFFFICFICPKHMMFFFKNHQVSFRRMSRSSACFFHRINVF